MDPQPDSWQRRIEWASLSDVGLRRANNQDSLAVMVAGSAATWRQRGDLFMVADGMGAHAAGELASKLAADTVPLSYQKLVDRSPPEALLTAVQEANALIHSRGQGNPEFKGMGTTSTTLVLLPQGAVLAHVGDSRAYRLRQNRLEQLTFDHSLVWEMRASGQISANIDLDFIPKNVITRSLGPSATAKVDIEGPWPIAPGDAFLLCSDGLSGQVKDEEIGMILASLAPAEAVRALVDLANLRGGPDNITVIVVRAGRDFWGTPAEAESGMSDSGLSIRAFLWLLLMAFSAVGVGFGIAEMPMAAVLAIFAAVMFGVGAFFQKKEPKTVAFPQAGKPLGRGPFTATNAAPNDEFANRLAGIAQDLSQAAGQTDFPVDRGAFDTMCHLAATARQSGDFCKAVAQYCGAISFMLAELKRKGQARNGPK